MPRPVFAQSATTGSPHLTDSTSQPRVAESSALKPTYSDASSSYWPPGWDFSRFSRATDADRAALPPGELERMQAGLRDVLGEDGVASLAMQLFREEQARLKPDTKKVDVRDGCGEGEMAPPNWLRRWRKRSQPGSDVDGGTNWPWGFVVFCVGAYGGIHDPDRQDPTRWDEYKNQIETLVRLPFQHHGEGTSTVSPVDYHDAAAGFELRWVEDEALAGADAAVLRTRYTEMRGSLPSGLAQDVFLCASNEAIASVVDSGGVAHPTTGGTRFCPDGPFLLALAADGDTGLEEGHEEIGWFKPVFRVAVETVADELWWLVDSQAMPLRRLTRFVQGSGELSGEVSRTEDAELERIWWIMAPSPARLRERRGVFTDPPAPT